MVMKNIGHFDLFKCLGRWHVKLGGACRFLSQFSVKFFFLWNPGETFFPPLFRSGAKRWKDDLSIYFLSLFFHLSTKPNKMHRNDFVQQHNQVRIVISRSCNFIVNSNATMKFKGRSLFLQR